MKGRARELLRIPLAPSSPSPIAYRHADTTYVQSHLALQATSKPIYGSGPSKRLTSNQASAAPPHLRSIFVATPPLSRGRPANLPHASLAMLCSSAGSASPFGQPSHRYSASCRSPHPGSGLSRRAYCSGAKAHGTANLQPRPAAVAPRLALWCFASHILCISLSPECAVFRGSSLAFSAAALWIIEGQRQFACGAPRNGRALANLGGGAAVEPDLARSTASILRRGGGIRVRMPRTGARCAGPNTDPTERIPCSRT